MSDEKGRQNVKRFFIQSTADIHKRLQHLAIDRETSAEKLAGEMVAEAVARAEADAKKTKPK